MADRYFREMSQHSPMFLTELGSAQRQDEYDDLSPDGLALQANLAAETLETLDAMEADDLIDATTIAAMQERLGLQVETHEAHADLSDINNIACGLLSLREIYDIMPTATPEQWDTIARRLHAIPAAAEGWFTSQFAGVDAGIRPAMRQVQALASLCDEYAAPDGFFAELAGQAGHDCPGLPPQIGENLDDGIAVARAEFDAAAARLRDQVLPLAVKADAVGPTRYELASREFLGMKADYAKVYQWGLEEVARLEAEQEAICARLRPGLSVAQTKASLDEDPAYQLHGTAALQTWMQGKADAAIAALNGTQFDIAEPTQTLECHIAKTHDGGIWYTPPSDDFARPGRMWWSVPVGQTRFGTWRELTTVYHEGVPGHHLQICAAILRRGELNSWRRQGCWCSGHGEGWALYAEALMAELGFLDDPAARLGQLDSEQMRAVRVVIDVGLHCGFDAPAEVGGGAWTWDKAWDFFTRHVSVDDGVAHFEVMRYFGWPGQASSYKIGQRVWQRIRAIVQQRQGDAFSLKDFHARALDLGSLGLDTLRDALVRQF